MPPGSRATAIGAVALAIGAIILVRTLVQNRLRYKEEAFCDYYAWSLELRLGGDPWIPASDPSFRARPGVPHRGVCNYPPVFLEAFEPLTKLSRPAAFWILRAILVASIFASAILIVGESDAPGGAAPYLIATAAVLLFPETYGALYESEPTLMLLAMLLGALALDRREHHASAGFLFALATLLKFYPGLVGCYFLLRRRWATVGWSVGFALAGIVVGGVSYHYELMRFGVPITNQWWIQDRAIGVLQTIRAIVASIGGNRFTPNTTAAWIAVSAVLYILIGTAGVDATIRTSDRKDQDMIAFGVWISAALLFSPLAWAHELPLMLPVFLGAAICIANGAPWKNARAMLLLIGLAMTIAPYFTSPLRRMHLFFAGAILSYAAAWLLIREWGGNSNSEAMALAFNRRARNVVGG